VAVGGELFRASRSEFVPARFTNGQSPELYWVRNLFSCRDGSLLVASVNGVFRFKNGSARHWSTDDGLAENNVLWVCEDKEGIIWAGLATGIARINGNQICNITRNDGLADNFISAIVPDDRGDLWMHSSRGILRASRQNLNDFAGGKVHQVECSVYDGLESLKTIDTTDVEGTACKTANGRIWFPSPQGAIMVDPANLPANPVPPPVHIQRLRINGIEFSSSAHAGIKPGRGELEFEYTALSYIAPQKVQFRYRLEGYDPQWVDAGSRRSAFYTNLKPSKYRFHVQASNADGVWNTAGDSFEVELPPHFVQTATFKALAGLLAVAALLGVYIWRVRHLHHRQQKLQNANDALESKVRQRTAELAEQRNMLRILIDHLPDNIFVKDMQSRIVLDNIAHARNLGAENPDAVVGKSDFDFFPKELAETFYSAEQQLLKSGDMFNGEEVSLNRATGQPRWTRTTKVALRDSQGKIIGLAGINRDITERKQWEAKLESLHKQLVDASRHAGMAEVATSVLHNVGNVLNSVNVAASVVEDKLNNSSDTKLAKVVSLLHENEKDLAHFLIHHEKGRQVLGFLDLLVEHLGEEKAEVLKEMKGLVRNIEHIKEIVAMQQSYAKVAGVEETVSAPELVEDALRMHLAAYQRHSVQLVREFSEAPSLSVDRHKVIQILVNLLQNAKYACDAKQSHDRKVTVRVGPANGNRVRIEVQDNGIGIPAENLTRIFSHGFTTRKEGHGYGLHSGALAAKEMGGTLTARSQGPGQGASFVLELPAGLHPRRMQNGE
jgi:PAS domain S-box-containing protein